MRIQLRRGESSTLLQEFIDYFINRRVIQHLLVVQPWSSNVSLLRAETVRYFWWVERVLEVLDYH